MLRIAVDVDEVLTPLLPTMMKWRKPRVPVPPKYPYIYRKIYGVSEEESALMVREFYDSEEFANLPVIPGALECLTDLKQKSRLYVMTGRQNIVRSKTEKWIEQNFPGIFTDVILTNSFTKNEVSKAELCKILNIGLLIDDNLPACYDCRDSKILALNFIGDPVYPWCYENKFSMKTWKQVNDTLNGNPKLF
jgi:5'(3')-deoxyribonucleotidase